MKSHFALALKALRQLGPRQVGWFAWYQLLLRSGMLDRLTPPGESRSRRQPTSCAIQPLLALPDRARLLALLGPQGVQGAVEAGDEIVAGQVRLFGGLPVPLDLVPDGPLPHWTASERRSPGYADIKFTWEPARFGWAFTLGRAYYLSADESYPQAFWRHIETFLAANPLNLGPNWASAQEVALRLIAFVFAAQVFAPSDHSTPERMARLSQAITRHAARIPPTLAYARAQNNNHLLSEAAGLITAGLALSDHPQAAAWLKLGARHFNQGLRVQIAPDGAYCQHSTNYHRLMLQLAVWVSSLSIRRSTPGEGLIQPAGLAALESATRWLLALCDAQHGRTPNLGPNDGAYLFPLTGLPFDDYRPALQAAAGAFLGAPAFDPGPWDEMALWLAADNNPAPAQPVRLLPSPPLPGVLRRPSDQSWAYLRAARFTSRPGHADQLHLDLWWRGLNVAQDAGTYFYNAPPPWDNSLAGACVHNTITVDGLDQMTRAGRFLYLDWAQAEIAASVAPGEAGCSQLTARHKGYLRCGMIHTRTVTARQDHAWLVQDWIRPATDAAARRQHTARLHWLLPDWPWSLPATDEPGLTLLLDSPQGPISLRIASHPAPGAPPLGVSLLRAGVVLHGSAPAASWMGWTSPTYGTKIPALSLVVEVKSRLPVGMTSEWLFPR